MAKKPTKEKRYKILWRVLDNASRIIETFSYSDKAKADNLAKTMNDDILIIHGKPFYVQPQRDEIP